MPPASPLPRRHGVGASWVRTPDRDPDAAAPWASMGEFLQARLASHAPVADMLAAGAFVDAIGRLISAAEPYRPNAFVWFHRPLADEIEVPFPLEVLYEDDRIVVVDKPHFLATTPRGSHVTQSVVVRARLALNQPELTPAHRLDRLTAGVLVLTTHPRWRAAYAGVFQDRLAKKTYEAIAPYSPALAFPRTETSHVTKRRSVLQAEIAPGLEPNAETLIEMVERSGNLARYRLSPRTGKTHQLRLQLSALGIPIVGDPLYPVVREVASDDFSNPLLLVARSLAFADPIDQTPRRFTSQARLDWPPEPGAEPG